MADTFSVKDKDQKSLADNTPSPVTISDLTPNTVYSGWTATKNDSTSQLAIPDQTTLPSKPTLTVTAGDASAKALLTLAKGDGSAPLTGATIQYKTGDGDWQDAATDLATLTANLADLTNGTAYDLQGKVTNASGDSALATATVTPAPATVAVETVTLSQATVTGDVGKTTAVTATVVPENATDKIIKWTTSDDKVATVADGTITFVAPGTATITATAGDKSATVKVTVKTPVVAVIGVTVDPATASVEVGKTVVLTGTVAPDNATDKTIAWTSSDDTIATVADGTVTGVKAGEATITATANGKTGTAKVTVTAPAAPAAG